MTRQRIILAGVALLILVFLAFRFWPVKDPQPTHQAEINQALDSTKYYLEKAELKNKEKIEAQAEAVKYWKNYEALKDSMRYDTSVFLRDLRARNRAEILDSIRAAEIRDSLRR